MIWPAVRNSTPTGGLSIVQHTRIFWVSVGILADVDPYSLLMSHLDDWLADRPSRLSVPEVADLLGVQPATVYKWLADGLVPGYKLAGVWVILREELKDLIASGRNSPPVSTEQEAGRKPGRPGPDAPHAPMAVPTDTSGSPADVSDSPAPAAPALDEPVVRGRARARKNAKKTKPPESSGP